MTQFDKLLQRFLSKPKDFTWAELTKILLGYGYEEITAGKTGGSRVRFIHDDYPPIMLHKPHPKPTLKDYQLRQILEALTVRGQI